jgi:hypothetical protein
MTTTAVAGSQILWKFAATAYTSQVTGGSLSTEINIARTKVLDGAAYPKVDASSSASVSLLFDDEAASYGALNTAAIAGTGTAVEWTIGDSKFTGTMYITSLSVDFAADGVTSASCSMIGELFTLADVTP